MEAKMKVRKSVWIRWILILSLVVSGLGLAGISTCSAQTNYQDRPDPSYCDSYARDYANHYNTAGRDVVGGAIGGAAAGALLGGILGGGRGAGEGAAIGGGVGAVGGGVNASQSWNDNYRRAYDGCMRGEN
jgi:hypothetical protein